jgi:hypothetical protein
MRLLVRLSIIFAGIVAVRIAMPHASPGAEIVAILAIIIIARVVSRQIG